MLAIPPTSPRFLVNSPSATSYIWGHSTPQPASASAAPMVSAQASIPMVSPEIRSTAVPAPNSATALNASFLVLVRTAK